MDLHRHLERYLHRHLVRRLHRHLVRHQGFLAIHFHLHLIKLQSLYLSCRENSTLKRFSLSGDYHQVFCLRR